MRISFFLPCFSYLIWEVYVSVSRLLRSCLIGAHAVDAGTAVVRHATKKEREDADLSVWALGLVWGSRLSASFTGMQSEQAWIVRKRAPIIRSWHCTGD